MTELDGAIRQRLFQRLGIGVGDDKLDTLQIGADHVVNGISARAAYADDANPRLQVVVVIVRD